MASSSDFVLYNYFRSSASYRVRIALELKGITYEYRPVHLLNNGGEQHGAEYQKLNPSREVPTLVHKGKTLAQSLAIIDYLDSVVPAPQLFPKDPFQRALVMQACEVINSGAQPLINLRVQKFLGTLLGASDEKTAEWTKHWIQYGLESLEKFLKPYAGNFCFGDSVSAADCVLIPHMFSAARNSVATDSYPTLKRVTANCEAHVAFKKASPSEQPDFPKS